MLDVVLITLIRAWLRDGPGCPCHTGRGSARGAAVFVPGDRGKLVQTPPQGRLVRRGRAGRRAALRDTQRVGSDADPGWHSGGGLSPGPSPRHRTGTCECLQAPTQTARVSLVPTPLSVTAQSVPRGRVPSGGGLPSTPTQPRTACRARAPHSALPSSCFGSTVTGQQYEAHRQPSGHLKASNSRHAQH